MATTTEIDQIHTVPPPQPAAEPPKRPRGRPRKVVTEPIDDDEPEEIAAAPGKSDFWIELSNLTDDDWTRHIAYLYRLSPSIDRRSSGRPMNLRKYVTKFDLDDVMHEHGSGAYRVDLTRIDVASGKSFRIAQHKFDIMNMDYPPRVPAGDWIDDPANQAWKWAIPKLEAAAAQSNGNGGPSLTAISDMMEKADERALRMVEVMTPKGTGNLETVLATMVQMNSPERLIALVQAIAPKQDNSLMTMLMEDRKQAREELAVLREKLLAPAAPQKSIIEQFIEIRPQIKELVDAFATKTGKTDVWASLAEKGIEQLPDLIQLGHDFVKRGDKPAPPAFQPRPQISAPPTAATPNAQPAAPADMPIKSVDQMTEDEKRQYVDHLWNKYGPHLLGISSKLVEEYKVQDQGYSFRDWYCEMYGKLR